MSGITQVYLNDEELKVLKSRKSIMVILRASGTEVVVSGDLIRDGKVILSVGRMVAVLKSSRSKDRVREGTSSVSGISLITSGGLKQKHLYGTSGFLTLEDMKRFYSSSQGGVNTPLLVVELSWCEES